MRSLAEFCSLQVSVETYVAPKGPLQCKRCQSFGHMQRYCGYAQRCVACSDVHLSRKFSNSQQQLKCSSFGENHTANYRGLVKWKEAKAPPAKRVSFQRSKGAVKPFLPPLRRQKGRSRTPSRRTLDPTGTTLSVGAVLSRLLLHLLPTTLPALSLKALLGIKRQPPGRKARMKIQRPKSR